MKVRDIMQSLHLITGGPTSSVEDVSARMTISRISGIPIVDDDGAPVGIVTEFDVIRAIRNGKNPSTTPTSEIMSERIIWLHPDDSVETAFRLLDHVRIIRVLVVEDEKLVGILSRGDLLRAALTKPELSLAVLD